LDIRKEGGISANMAYPALFFMLKNIFIKKDEK